MGVDEKISVVMPVFNEAAVIERVVDDVVREVVGVVPDGEIVVVDDCSSDETPALLERLAARQACVRVLRNGTNQGHGPSLVRGLDEARHRWIFLMDSDAQFVTREFGSLWELRNDADLVLGRRRARAGARHRSALSRVLETIVSRLARRRLPDPNVPFKLFRRSIWRDLRVVVADDAHVPSVMIAMGAALRGWRIEHVPVTHLPRTHAPSSLRGIRLARFSVAAVAELFAFRRRVRGMDSRVDDPEDAARGSSSLA